MDHKKKISLLMSPIVQQSFINRANKFIKYLKIKKGHSVLDIGSGTGYLKKIIEQLGAKYTGIEPNFISYNSALKLYGKSNFYNFNYPNDQINKRYNYIISLTCLDEVENKKLFIKSLHENLSQEGIAYISVRNSDFILNPFKNFLKTLIRCISINYFFKNKNKLIDLNLYSYNSLFLESSFEILEYGKFLRPWILPPLTVGIRNIFYQLLSLILPINRSYMIYFILKPNR